MQVEKLRRGVSWWLGRLRIWHCCCSGVSSIPGLGTCCGHGPREKKKKGKLGIIRDRYLQLSGREFSTAGNHGTDPIYLLWAPVGTPASGGDMMVLQAGPVFRGPLQKRITCAGLVPEKGFSFHPSPLSQIWPSRSREQGCLGRIPRQKSYVIW